LRFHKKRKLIVAPLEALQGKEVNIFDFATEKNKSLCGLSWERYISCGRIPEEIT